MRALIEDYAMIGDGETAALVSRNGAIEWLCWPRFDSNACMAALLGNEQHGHWTIAPSGESTVTRRYQNDTLILETDFKTTSGTVRIVDFMPMRTENSVVFRIIIGLEGRVMIQSDLQLRFDYGSVAPWISTHDDCVVVESGPDRITLRAPVPVTHEHGQITSIFSVEAGQRIAFSLCYSESCDTLPPPVDAEAALAATSDFWHNWIGKFTKQTEFPDAVRRSLITLKALIYKPSGGLVAAPTTSLPEIPGGPSNWDYRFTWLRDSTFTLTALLNAGFVDEARAWQDWILRAIGGDPARMRIMYRIDGARHIPEWSVPWLPGYNWASPVRIGNAASTQHQADIYGEVIDAFHLGARAGIGWTERSLAAELAIVEHIEKTWHLPGAGLWESRGEQRHYVYARAMAWVGLERFIKTHETRVSIDAATLERFSALRDTIHAEVCRAGYHSGLGRFVEYFGGHAIDASLLLLPLIGFLPIDDPRITATIDAIEYELMEGGFVRRQKPKPPTPEGAFLACSFWLADCRTMQGRKDDARAIVERVLAIRNDVGLLSEEYDVPGRRLAGNFPQALSHLALVSTILGLSGPILQRAGG